MKRNAGDYIITVVVVLCSAALLTALTIALTGRKFRDDDRILFVDFPDIAGIKLYSQVRYGGALAGEVRAIRLLDPSERENSSTPQNTVRISIVLDKDLPALPADVTVGLGSDTLLSEKFVAVNGGDPSGGVLQNGAILSGRPGMNLDRLMPMAETLLASASDLVDRLEPLMNNTEGLLGDIHERLDVTLPKLDELIDRAKRVASSADDLIGHADSLISDNEENVRENVSELRLAIGSVKNLFGKASGFVGTAGAQVAARMEELEVVLENLKVITTHAKAITETLGERPSRLIWPSKRRKLPSEEVILRNDKPVPVAPLD
jgi:ABC-type transporter Mla subunit MlaD